MKIFVNPTYKQIKENLNVILLLPAFLGGLWQTLELSSISTSFIRFFSVSQLVADGTLILFLFISAYLGLLIVRLFFSDSSSISDPKTDDINIHKKNRYINIFRLVVTGIVFYFCLLPFFIGISETQQISPIIFLALFPLTIILIIVFVSSLISLVQSFERIKKRDGKSVWDIFIRILALVLFLIAAKGSLFMITAFHKSFLLPNNLKNLDYIKCKFNRYGGSSLNLEILYFNDKYIFLEFKTEHDKRIEILSFDEFLHSEKCDSVQKIK